MRFRKQAHATYFFEYHIVVTTKYRHAWTNEGIFAYLELKLTAITKWYPELVYEVVNHDRYHIHLLISIQPKLGVSDVV